MQNYAKTNAREYFADFFVYYIRSLDSEDAAQRLRENAPQTYRYMKQLEASGWFPDSRPS